MALADAVYELPGLCPATASLAGLAQGRPVEDRLRTDPGAVFFLAQHRRQISSEFFTAPLDDAALLAALDLVERGSHAFVDWRRTPNDAVWRTSQSIARLSESLAQKVGVSAPLAWIAGLAVPIGWFAAAAVAPDRLDAWLRDPAALNHASLARRLVRSWRLPEWLADLVGHLDWHLDLLTRLGVDAKLAAVVQLAVHAIEADGRGLGLNVGTPMADLLDHLGLVDDDVLAPAVESLAGRAGAEFEDPRSQPLLAEVLRLTIANRQRRDAEWIERLHRDIEKIESALMSQIASESERLKTGKLKSLGEFAAGAGHEINNPLAVISGQAQYILKQLAWAEELLLEDPTPAAVLEAIKAKTTKPLQTIVTQAQRIHHVITDLMQFARPQPPRRSVTPVAKLAAEAVAAVRSLAEDRRVRIVCPEPPSTLAVYVDAGQIRLALTNLLRNAIEAAPPDGWATLRIQRDAANGVVFAVEDNGPGPDELQRDHLFDPFFSGRSAGRGRGLGLSTAWRLATLHGGDIRLDPAAHGVTRFILTLPPTDVIEDHVAAGKREQIGLRLTGAAS